MRFTALFVFRPIATLLLALAITFSGLISFNLLPVASLPQIEFPTINVQASLPGASPEIMASSVATPLEKQIGKIAGITELTSTSSLGSTRISVQFELNRDIDGAARDIQAAINAARSQLPTELPRNPTYRKVNPADSPIMILALTSNIFTNGQMYDYASTILQQKISQVDGVGQVSVGGSSLPAVRVEINPTALNKYGIPLRDVRNILVNANSNLPKGQLSDDKFSSEINTNDQLFKAAEYEPLIITYKNGAAVKISDIAEVNDSVEDLRNLGLANGKPSVLLVIFKQPAANVIETVDNVKKIMPELSATIPSSIEMIQILDRTDTIRASLHEVKITLFIAFILVVMVIYIFLRNIRAAIIPSIAVPLSLLGTFSVMYLLDYSLDNLSLMALTIATGFVVDDAVVVVENVIRHIESGKSALKATLLGVKEVGFTVLSMTISLIAVFIPLLFMGGIVGRLLREFAVTLSIAVFTSLIISLTVTPMLCATILKTYKHKPKEERYLIKHLRDKYKNALKWTLDNPNVILILSFGTIFLTIYLYIIVPKGFFPIQDTGRIMGSIQAQQDISFQAMKEKLIDFVKIVQEDEAVKNVAGFIGGTGNTNNSGSMFIILKPRNERDVSADEVINRLRAKLNTVPAATLFLRSAQDLTIGGRGGNAQFIYSISAYDLPTLNIWSQNILKQLSGMPGIADINSDQLNHGLQLYVKVDRDKAAHFGISSSDIDNVLYDAFGQRQVSVMYTLLNQYHVVMEVAPQYWQNPQTLHDIYIPSADNKLIPLSTIAQFEPMSSLLSVSHQGQFPAASLSFNLLPGISLGDAVNKINAEISSMNLPVDMVNGSFQGTAKAFQATLANQPYLIMAALIAVYIVLGMLYESMIHPITILSTLPSAGVGALVALLVTKTELSLIALIGIILLIGLVKKNAIMMIDFALMLERNYQKSSKDAILEASLLRFRPIMMTTMAAMLSAVPLAIGTGVGAELRQPLGIAIIGGLLFSQILTLFTTPVIYLTFENWRQKYLKKNNPHQPDEVYIS